MDHQDKSVAKALLEFKRLLAYHILKIEYSSQPQQGMTKDLHIILQQLYATKEQLLPGMNDSQLPQMAQDLKLVVSQSEPDSIRIKEDLLEELELFQFRFNLTITH